MEAIQLGPNDNLHIPNQSLGTLFYNELKKKDPNKEILIDDTTSETVNYKKLLNISVKLAISLQKMGLKTGDTITIVSENNWKYLVSILASFFIGTTVNLLNHDYTSGELKHFFKICQPTLIFCTTKTVESILKLKNETFFRAENIVIYDAESRNEIKKFDNLLETVSEDDSFTALDLDPEQEVALILTSSGTTGLPKCVSLTHTNAKTILTYAGDPDCFDFNENERTLGYLPFFHIFGCALGLASIFFGTTYYILNKFKPDQFLKIIESHKITKLFVVPPVLQFLVKSPLVDKHEISSLQDIVCGGAPVGKHLLEMAEKRLNIRFVRQIYGMTEVSGAALVVPKYISKCGSAGKVTTTYKIKISDLETGRPLPPNRTGELRIAGPGIMKGYLGNDTESKAAFDEEGFIKSGDLGYYDEDGFFYIIDRIKEIIKYKGFQVAPAELENLLLQHPSVKDAAVIGIPDERSGEVPLAFVVKQADKKVTDTELVQFIEENISVQKRLYGGVRFIKEIPKNGSGKIIRWKLKEFL